MRLLSVALHLGYSHHSVPNALKAEATKTNQRKTYENHQGKKTSEKTVVFALLRRRLEEGKGLWMIIYVFLRDLLFTSNIRLGCLLGVLSCFVYLNASNKLEENHFVQSADSLCA